MNSKKLTSTALLATILAILGMFKLPGLFPGAEFQLSAPFAVCLAACFGFRRYIQIGILASLINFISGTHTIINITVAMIFRLVAGGLIGICGANPLTLLVSGPLGTAAGRLALAPMLGTEPVPLLLAAIPGMFYTAAGALLLYPLMKRLTLRLYGETPQKQKNIKGSVPNDRANNNSII